MNISPVHDFNQLRQAILQAPIGQEIFVRVAADIIMEETVCVKDKRLVLEGGHKLTAAHGVSRHFNVTSGALTLRHITLSGNDKAAGYSGGLTVSGGKLILGDKASILNCRGENIGGAVTVIDGADFYMKEGSLIKECSFLNCGGVYLQGASQETRFFFLGGSIENCWGNLSGGVSLNGNATMIQQGGIMSENVGYHGGGIRLNQGEFQFLGGAIEKNRAIKSGGGLYIGRTAHFIQENGVFSDNIAGRSGSDIWAENAVTRKKLGIFA